MIYSAAFRCVACCCLLVVGVVNAKESPVASSKKGIVDAAPESGPSIKVDGGFMVPYTEQIPGTDVSFEMIPVPGGEFLLGSPKDEADRNEDEGPQVRVKVAPFWIGKHEVTWGEYRSFMAMYDAFKTIQRIAGDPEKEAPDAAKAIVKLLQDHAWNDSLATDWNVDAVTSPTPLYDSSFTYAVGNAPNQPAVTITPFSARQYTKWISGILGDNYRLPTETEWEYAARAGTTTPWSFGSDVGELEQYAWVDSNGDSQTHPVGTKKPNPWGLYDMHGNVAEWTLDQYYPDAYAKLGAGPVEANAAVRWPDKLFPRVIRGGSWLETPAMSRSAARQQSEDREWKLSDPNIPLSPWWFTEEPATAVGMRIIRPLTPLTADEKKRVWEADIEYVREDVNDRLQEGRGALGVADESLPAAVREAEKINKGS